MAFVKFIRTNNGSTLTETAALQQSAQSGNIEKVYFANQSSGNNGCIIIGGRRFS